MTKPVKRKTATKKPATKKVGAPAFPWTEAIEAEIWKRLGAGESMKSITSDKGMPSTDTVYRRLQVDDAFRDSYTRAREVQADTIFEEILGIADDSAADFEIVDGVPKLNSDAVQRARLRIDARKWVAGKLRPKVYGEKIDATLSNPDGSNITFSTIFETKPPA